MVWVKRQDQPEHDHGGLERQVRDGDRYPPAQLADVDADQVVEGDERNHAEGNDDLGGAVAERRPERGEIRRHGQRRHGEQDRVVEHDRPARDEADELVEGVPREYGRAAPLRVQRCSLRVCHRGQLEEQSRGQKDERSKSVGVVGDNAEREIDRADRGRVDDREQRAGGEGPLVHVRVCGCLTGS